MTNDTDTEKNMSTANSNTKAIFKKTNDTETGNSSNRTEQSATKADSGTTTPYLQLRIDSPNGDSSAINHLITVYRTPIKKCGLRSKICCTAEQFLLHGGRKSAARRTELCCTADGTLLHGGRKSAARQTELCKATDFQVPMVSHKKGERIQKIARPKFPFSICKRYIFSLFMRISLPLPIKRRIFTPQLRRNRPKLQQKTTCFTH